MLENEVVSKKEDEDDEISLIDLIAVLLKYKSMIITATIISIIGIIVFCIISLKLSPKVSPLPNKFTSEAKMFIKDSEAGGGLSSSLSGAASLLGINVGGQSQSNSALALYLASSNELLDSLNKKFDFVERYEIKEYPIATTRMELLKVLKSSIDTESGVFTISFTDIDPVFAKEVVDFAVDWVEKKFDELGVDTNTIKKKNLELNLDSTYKEILKLQTEMQTLGEATSQSYAWNIPTISIETTRIQMELSAQQEVYKQLKTQYELIKIEMASEQPVFQILTKAEVPDKKSGPSRGKLCIIVVFATFFLAVFLAFLLNAIENVKKDPEAMQKLSSTKKNKKNKK